MIRRIVLTLALAVILAAPVRAQSIWLDREHRPSVLAEIYFPNFDGADSHFPTWTWFVATRLSIGPTASFVGELPYTRGEFGTGPITTSESAVGNPYLGVELAPHPSGMRYELGVRLPVMSDEKPTAFVMGYLTDITRQEAFVPGQLPVRIGLHYHSPPKADGHVGCDLRLVPTVWIKTSDTVLSESEFFLGYGGTVRYEGADVRVGGGLSGTWNVSSDGGDFGESSFHALELEADFLHGSVRPGVQLKLPLDDGLQSAVDTVWGLSVMILP